MNIHKLLAINFGGIGDEILFLPVLKSIKNAYPSIHITLLLEPRSKAIRDVSNLIDEIKLFDIKKRPLLPQDYFELLDIMRQGNFRTVISSGSSPLVACLLFASGIKERIGYDSGTLSHLLLTQAVNLEKNQYAANMYHDLVQGIGLAKAQVVPKIDLPEINLLRMKDYLSSQGHLADNIRRLIIHPGTSRLAKEKGIIKIWSNTHWANLIDKFIARNDTQIILAGGPDDEDTIAQIKKELNQKSLSSPLFVCAYGVTKSLADLAALIFISDLLVCVDSAPMHVAVALNKPVLALFGPTDPAKLLPVGTYWRYIKSDESQMNSTISKNIESIRIQPDDVYRSALDLLQPAKVQ